MEILKATNLSKIYQTGESAVYALNDVTLGIDEGSFVAITGPSGSGTVSHPEDLHFQQHETLGLKELYDTYTLRAFDAWNKDRYETCTFIMKPVK